MNECLVEMITGKYMYRKLKLSYSIGDCNNTNNTVAEYKKKYCVTCENFKKYEKCLSNVVIKNA